MRHGCVKTSQAFAGLRLAGKLGAPSLADAGVHAFSYLAQDRVFAGKIAKKCGLADFEGLDDVIDTCGFVSVLAKQADGSIDDLLAQARFFALAEAQVGWRFKCLGRRI